MKMSKPIDDELVYTLISGVVDGCNADNFINSIHLNSRANGLHHKHFVPLIKLALSQKLSEKQSTLILKCLTPRTFVPWKAVIIGISNMCTNKLTKRIQTRVAEWIYKIFKNIDDTKPLHSLYDILFHYLDTDYVSFYVVNILSNLTKKSDVKRYRIEKLFQLCQKSSPTHFTKLLHHYRTLCPDEVACVFRADCDSPGSVQEKSSDIRLKSRMTLKNPESMPFHGSDSIYARLKTGNEFVFPSLPLVLLRSPQTLFDLCIQYKLDIPLRLDTWLKFYLAQYDKRSELDRILSDLSHFQEHIQEAVPASSSFLKRCLKKYKFNDNSIPILELVSWIPICPINDLYETFLEPLVKICFNSSCKQQLVLIIHTLTNMVRNFAFVEMNKRNSTHIKIFNNQNKETEHKSLNILVEFIYNMSELHIELVKRTSNLSVLYAIMSFYELIPDLHLKYDLPIIELPPQPIIEICLLSSNAFTIARLCALICRYKFAFKSLKLQLERGGKDTSEILNRSLKHIKAFNSRLLLICDILFRNRAFTHPSASFYLQLETLNHFSIDRKQEKLSLFYHIALIGHTFQFLGDTQNDNKIDALWGIFAKPQLRTLYFEFLKKQNLFGIVEFFNEYISKKLT